MEPMFNKETLERCRNNPDAEIFIETLAEKLWLFSDRNGIPIGIGGEL